MPLSLCWAVAVSDAGHTPGEYKCMTCCARAALLILCFWSRLHFRQLSLGLRSTRMLLYFACVFGSHHHAIAVSGSFNGTTAGRAAAIAGILGAPKTMC